MSRGPELATWHWGEPVDRLRQALAAGGLVVIPSESSYGLGVDPRNPRGVAAVYAVKERDRGKPLPVVLADPAQLALLGVAADLPQVQAVEPFWPAPLSLVVPLPVPLPAAGDGATLAIRVPAHARLRQLLAQLGMPLTATSANRSQAPPICDPAELPALFNGVDITGPVWIVDDGVLPGGPPSTLVSWEPAGFHVLRSGAFPPARLTARDGILAGGKDMGPS